MRFKRLFSPAVPISVDIARDPARFEAVANDDIDQEFAIGPFNRRGVTTPMPTDVGG